MRELPGSPLAVLCPLAPVAILLLAGAASAQTDLRWRLATGQRFEVRLSQTGSTEAQIAGQTYKSSLKATAVLNWRVVGVDADGTAAIDQTLSHLTVALDLPGVEPVHYDSASQQPAAGAAKAVADEFRPLVGKTVRLRLTSTGEIQESNAAGRGESRSPAFRAGDIQQLLGRLLPPLPVQPVSPGDSWKDKPEHLTPQGKVQIEGCFEFRGSDPDQASLERIDAAYEFAAPAPQQGLKLAFDDQDNRGVYSFDATAGRLVQGQIRQAMTLRLTVEGAEVAQKSTTEMRIEVRPAP